MGTARKLTRAGRNIAWIEAYCRVPEGRLVGKPVKLSPDQRRWLHRIYDSPTRTFILSMGRKNAKTAFSAFILLLHLCGPEVKPNSQILSAAQSQDQAAVLFDLAAKMVRMSQELSACVIVRDTLKQLVCPELGAVYKAMSAEAATAYGKSPVLVIHDELGQVRGPRSQLYEALETASAAQEEPLSIVISTQAASDADLLSVLIDDALSGADPRIKVELYVAPLDADPFDEDTIRKANPHYDVFMNKVEVQRQASDAKRMPSMEAGYRNLVLNQRVEATSPFVSLSVWKANGKAPLDEAFAEGDVYAGIDLSARTDLTAVVLAARYRGEWHIRPYCFTPLLGLHERARRDRKPYDVWVGQGHLIATPGGTVDYDYVAEFLMGLSASTNWTAAGYDRWRMDILLAALQRQGAGETFLETFHQVAQTTKSMDPALDLMEGELMEGRVRHGMHPVLTMCAANARVHRDSSGGRKFEKATQTGRIDAMSALGNAFSVAVSTGVREADAQLTAEVW